MKFWKVVLPVFALLIYCWPAFGQKGVPDVEGTTWQYTDEDSDYQITFSPNGKLTTTHPNDKTPNNDTWEQSGKTIRFWFNNKYSRYKGKMKNGNTIKGKGRSVAGVWRFKLELIP